MVVVNVREDDVASSCIAIESMEMYSVVNATRKHGSSRHRYRVDTRADVEIMAVVGWGGRWRMT